MFCGGLDAWSEQLEDTALLPAQVQALRARAVPAVRRLRKQVRRLALVFSTGRLTVSAGALLVPSMASLEIAEEQRPILRWTTWGLGLLTSLCNAGISLFGVDRKYFALKDQLSRLESELWLFLALAGRYRNREGAIGHRGPYQEFIERLEHMLEKTVRTELATAASQPQSTPAIPALRTTSSAPAIPRQPTQPQVSAASDESRPPIRRNTFR